MQIVQHEYERLRTGEKFEELSYGSMAAKALLLNRDSLPEGAFRQRGKNRRELGPSFVTMSVIVFVVALGLCVLAALFGSEVRGARRWFDFGLFSLQPSEILKPAIVVFWAWMLSENMKQPRFPGRIIAIALYLLTAAAQTRAAGSAGGELG